MRFIAFMAVLLASSLLFAQESSDVPPFDAKPVPIIAYE
jgi:hypothetical protein